MKYLLTGFILFNLFSCDLIRLSDVDYDKVVRKKIKGGLWGYDHEELKYYNSNDQLVARRWNSILQKYKYDENGNLFKKIHCTGRFYNNCTRFEHYILDENGNEIAKIDNEQRDFNKSKIKFKQSKFYDDNSNLIRHVFGDSSSLFSIVYQYDNKNRKIASFSLLNNDTIRSDSYEYESERLVRQEGYIFTEKKNCHISQYKYNSRNKLDTIINRTLCENLGVVETGLETQYVIHHYNKNDSLVLVQSKNGNKTTSISYEYLK